MKSKVQELPSSKETSSSSILPCLSVKTKILLIFSLLLFMPTMKGCDYQVSYPLPVLDYHGRDWGGQAAYFETNIHFVFVNLLLLGSLLLLALWYARRQSGNEGLEKGVSFLLFFVSIHSVAGCIRVLSEYSVYVLVPVFSLVVAQAGHLISFGYFTTGGADEVTNTIVHILGYLFLMTLMFGLGYFLGPKKKFYSHPIFWIFLLHIVLLPVLLWFNVALVEIRN